MQLCTVRLSSESDRCSLPLPFPLPLSQLPWTLSSTLFALLLHPYGPLSLSSFFFSLLILLFALFSLTRPTFHFPLYFSTIFPSSFCLFFILFLCLAAEKTREGAKFFFLTNSFSSLLHHIKWRTNIFILPLVLCSFFFFFSYFILLLKNSSLWLLRT